MWFLTFLRGVGMFLCFLAYMSYLLEFEGWLYQAISSQLIAGGYNELVVVSAALSGCLFGWFLGLLILGLAFEGPLKPR